MIENVLIYQSSKLRYLCYNGGPKALIAFHGFGEKAEAFSKILPALLPRYTIYALDMPYHGQTMWEEDLFDENDIHNIINLLRIQEQFSRFSLMGYSMGGKILLKTFPLCVTSVQEVFLVASAGILDSRWTNAMFPNFIFENIKKLIKHPKVFNRLVNIAYKGGLLNRVLYHYVSKNMATPKQRTGIYHLWLSMKKMRPKLRLVKEKMTEQQTKVYLFYGKRDRVVPAEAGIRMAEDLPSAQLFLLDAGHNIINKKLNDKLAIVLNNQK